MRFKSLVVAVCVTGALFAGVGSASADPVNSKNAEIIELVCDSGLGTIEIVTHGNGQWTPGHLLSNNQMLIPYEFHFVGTFTPTVGLPETFSEHAVKKAPSNGRLATCTFHEEGTDEFGSFVFDGTVKVSYTKAR